jgi:hypothetical protein
VPYLADRYDYLVVNTVRCVNLNGTAPGPVRSVGAEERREEKTIGASAALAADCAVVYGRWRSKDGKRE